MTTHVSSSICCGNSSSSNKSFSDLSLQRTLIRWIHVLPQLSFPSNFDKPKRTVSAVISSNMVYSYMNPFYGLLICLNAGGVANHADPYQMLQFDLYCLLNAMWCLI